MKGTYTVFVYRFIKFIKNNHGNSDLMKWRTRFQIRRLAESWMDLLPELDLNSPTIQAEVVLPRSLTTMHRLHLQQQLINIWVNHSHMKWNKLSMMRLVGFTDKRIVISSHSFSLLRMFPRLKTELGEVKQWMNTERVS